MLTYLIDAQRAAMVSQMKVECCSVSPSLDIDRLLRELQDQGQEADGFTRIGPFGMIPISNFGQSQDLITSQTQKGEETQSVSTPDMTIALPEFVANGIEDFRILDSLRLGTSMALSNSSPNSSTEVFNGSFDPRNVLIPTPDDVYTGMGGDLTASQYETRQDRTWDTEFLDCKHLFITKKKCVQTFFNLRRLYRTTICKNSDFWGGPKTFASNPDDAE